jgi:hypothetical protein
VLISEIVLVNMGVLGGHPCSPFFFKIKTLRACCLSILRQIEKKAFFERRCVDFLTCVGEHGCP